MSDTSMPVEVPLDLHDLELTELEVTTEDDSYALPEAGASISWNSCSSVIVAL